MTNVRDCMGKTVSYHLSMFPKTSDAELKKISLNEQDWESGYNAFHLCLSSFQLQKSFKLYERCMNDSSDKGKSWKVKDRSGMTPLMLLESILIDTNQLSTAGISKCEDHTYRKCYNFGSNVNMQLGTGDNNDRMFVWYEIDPWKLTAEDMKFVSCTMTKYHSILMLSNDEGKRTCYVTGNSSKGRILHERDLLRYSPLPVFNPLKICSSDHHTVAFLSNETLALWGSNKYGQLNLNPNIETFVNEPRILNLGLCSDCLVNCSAVHTSILFQNGQLKSFGLDLGQMGTTSKYDKTISYLDGKGRVSYNLVTTELPSYISDFISLVCTEFVTYILCSGNKIFAITNHKIVKVNITMPSNDSFDKFFVRTFYHHKILDIKCKNAHGKFLTLLYNDGTVAIIADFKVSCLPVSYWTPKYSWDKCVSFDIGSEGQLILATLKGDVYTSLSPGKKFTRIKNGAAGSSMCAVHCDTLFASFNILFDVPSLQIPSKVEIKLRKQILTKGHDVYFHSSLSETFSCHKAILTNAQPQFVKALVKDGMIKWNLGGEQLLIRLEGADQPVWNIYLETTEGFAKYIRNCVLSYYSDDKKDEPLKVGCQKFANFVDYFKLPSSFSHIPDLNENIRNIFNESSSVLKPNTRIELANNKVFYAHSFVLALHSPYYERLFSDIWSNGKSSFVLDWKDISYEVCFSLFGYIHGHGPESLIPLNNDLSIGHSKYVEHLFDVLEVANKYMFDNFKTHLEIILCEYIDFTNVVGFWIISNQLFCPTIVNACEEYIIQDPSVLFDPESVRLLVENSTDEMWHSLENKFKKFANMKIPTKSWYLEPGAKRLVQLFRKDLKEFNSHFINPENKFELVIDVLGPKKIRRKTSGSSIRRSSFTKLKQNNQSEADMSNIRHPSISYENLKESTKNNMGTSHTAIDDENSDFISTTCRKTRRKSSIANTREITNTQFISNVQTSSVSERAKSLETSFPALGETNSKSNAPSKIIIKKQTQKERIRRITEEQKKKTDDKSTKTVWGKPRKELLGSNGAKNPDAQLKMNQNSFNQSSSTNFPTLQEAIRTGKRSTGIVSTTGDGTKPTMPLYLNKNKTFSWSTSSATSTSTKSMQDALEEARFMKWWEEESKRVQAEQHKLQELFKLGKPSKNLKPTKKNEGGIHDQKFHRKQDNQEPSIPLSKKQLLHKKNSNKSPHGRKKSKLPIQAISNT